MSRFVLILMALCALALANDAPQDLPKLPDIPSVSLQKKHLDKSDKVNMIANMQRRLEDAMSFLKSRSSAVKEDSADSSLEEKSNSDDDVIVPLIFDLYDYFILQRLVLYYEYNNEWLEGGSVKSSLEKFFTEKADVEQFIENNYSG